VDPNPATWAFANHHRSKLQTLNSSRRLTVSST